jgi:biopolymer transport protein ExbD
MAGTLGKSGRGREGIVGINVTPLVDVVLVLLIIMMVSATYIVSQALKVELPRTATADETVNRTFVVTVRQDGSYRFNDKDVSRDVLAAELKAAGAKGKETNLVISADKAATHGSVVDVIDLSKLAGITKFAINVERSQ